MTWRQDLRLTLGRAGLWLLGLSFALLWTIIAWLGETQGLALSLLYGGAA